MLRWCHCWSLADRRRIGGVCLSGEIARCQRRSERAIAKAIPAGNALDDVTKLNAAVTDLRAKRVSNAILIDSLISSYCPAVARNTALNDDQKRAQVRRFASRIVRVVYALDSADAVILDVPFRPTVVDAINAKAAAERISPEAWVANAVDRDLKAAR